MLGSGGSPFSAKSGRERANLLGGGSADSSAGGATAKGGDRAGCRGSRSAGGMTSDISVDWVYSVKSWDIREGLKGAGDRRLLSGGGGVEALLVGGGRVVIKSV